MPTIPDCFYRVSIKALILDADRQKFLLAKEADGRWELPGGGLDFGVAPQVDLAREIMEEMGLAVTQATDHPSYFFTFQDRHQVWRAAVLYEAKVEHLNFTPSDECVEVRFFNTEEALAENTFNSVKAFARMFDADRHASKMRTD